MRLSRQGRRRTADVLPASPNGASVPLLLRLAYGAYRWAAAVSAAIAQIYGLECQRRELLDLPDYLLRDMGITGIDASRIAAAARLRQRRILSAALRGSDPPELARGRDFALRQADR